MPTETLDRWPPVYDELELKKAIEELVDRDFIFSKFYGPQVQGSPIAQGDIIKLVTDLPYIDQDGSPAILDCDAITYWMITSVTCDLDREEVNTAHIVPIFDFLANLTQAGFGEKYRRYKAYRAFFLPPWDVSVENHFFVADLITPVTIDKQALINKAEVVATMSLEGWLLLNSCLVRYLARSDGRND